MFIGANLFYDYKYKPFPVRAQESLSIPIQQVARTYNKNGNIPDELNKYFTSIQSKDAWKNNYISNFVDSEKSGFCRNNLNLKTLSKREPCVNISDFIKNWAKLFLTNKKIYFDAFIAHESNFYQMVNSDGQQSISNSYDFPGRLSIFRNSISNNKKFGNTISLYQKKYTGTEFFQKSYEALKKDLKPDTKIISYNEFYNLFKNSEKPYQNSLFPKFINWWSKYFTYHFGQPTISNSVQNGIFNNIPTAFYLFLLLIGIVIRRKNYKEFLFVCPQIFLLVSLMLTIPVRNGRYIAPIYWILPFAFIAIYLFKNRKTQRE
jgi:hypothetical protein